MKNFFNNMKEVKKDERMQSLLFFGFYFIFFLVLILLLRGRDYGKDGFKTREYEPASPLTFSTNGLNLNNYSFNYIILLDGVKYEYIGKKNNDELFQYDNKEYFHHLDEYYMKDKEWVKVANPYLFSDFMKMDNIGTLLENSFYESKTNYDSGKDVYSLLISTNTINQKLFNINSDFLEEPNKITVSTNEKKDMNQIHYYLDSYCVLNKVCKKSLEIILSYDDFNLIEDIKNPTINNS